MRVRLNTIMAGPLGNHHPGDVVTLPDEQARDLIAGHFAEAIDAPETASIEPAENAMQKSGKARKG